MTGIHPFTIECPAVHAEENFPGYHWEQWRFEFANGHGASVVKGDYTYGGPAGKWELAVLTADGDLDYSTEITADVIGWLSEAEVTDLLERIARLP